MTTVETLTELVRTIGAAVEELSMMVAGMPARVDAKLAEVREYIHTTATGLHDQMEGLKSDAADIRGSLNSTVGAVRTELADVNRGLIEIIGDNRGAVDDQITNLTASINTFETRVSELATSMEQVTAQGAAAVAQLRGDMEVANVERDRRLDEQHTLISNVRTACDTTDLYLGIASLRADYTTAGERIETVNSGLAALTAQVAEATQRNSTWVNTVQAETAALRVELANSLEGIGTRFTTIAEERTRLNQELRLYVDNHDTDLREELETRIGLAVTSVNDTVEAARSATAEQFVLVGNTIERNIVQHTEAVQAVREYADKLATAGQTALATQIGEMSGRLDMVQAENATGRVDVQHSLEALDNTINVSNQQQARDVETLRNEVRSLAAGTGESIVTLTEQASATHGEVRQQAAELSTLVTQVKDLTETYTGAVEELRRGVQTTRENVQDINKGLADQMLDQASLRTNVASATEELGEVQKKILQLYESLNSTRVLAEMVNTRIADLSDETTQRLNSVVEELANRASTQSVEQATQQAVQEIQTVAGQFNASIAALETSLRGKLESHTETVEAAHSEVVQRVEQLATSIPAPFDSLPLRTELMAWLGEQFVERRDELTAFDFEVSVAEQGKLMFKLKQGGTEIIREVPLGLGIEYRGVYDREVSYDVGNFVTHRGSMWYAKNVPTGEPGKDIDGWQLAVKRGADGKDATPARIKHIRDSATGLIKESRIGYEGDDEQS